LILAAVLGGVDPFGRFGKVGGLMVALVLLQLISSAFNLPCSTSALPRRSRSGGR
jgi:ribose/xylose/arabinose/galactoside ABC-type transport system permease subunit